MSIQFFGQFLVARGEVDAAQLREALCLMESRNATLGDLAVAEGLLVSRDVARVHAEQHTRDLHFGDLCVEKGLLTAPQLVELLRKQNQHRLPLGEALVRLGHLAADRLAMLLDMFKADQAKYATGRVALPDALANHRAVAPTLSLFVRFAMRLARIHAKVGAVHAFESSPEFAEVRVSVALRGVQGLDVALVSNAEFAERIALATTGLDESDVDPEMVADGVGEFLNVFLGNVVTALAVEGHPMELGAPDYEAELADGWIADLAVDTGRAALVLSLF